MKRIEVGDHIPSFTLLNEQGEAVEINSELGQPLVLFFYPKDHTSGCTKQVCTFRDNFSEFTSLNVRVIGISGDAVASHKLFKEDYQLPFTLLSDPKNKIRSLFGVPKSLLFIPGRVTYIVDEKGIVRHIFDSMFEAEKHVSIAIQQLKKM